MQSPVHIYIIDDNAIDIMIVEHLLEFSFPHSHLHIFASGKQALETFNQKDQTVDPGLRVLLLDLNMPMLDGWEFLESYEQSAFYRRQPVPVYIFTASINPKDIAKSRSYRSVAGFFSKPLKEEHLHEMIKTISSPVNTNPSA